MNRRQLLRTIPLAASAPALRLPAAAGRARFRPAICAYSYREALQKKTMTYEDLVRRAVEYGIDGLDLTVYWFPSTSDDFLLPLRRLAYLSGIAIYAISIRTDMCRPPGPDREREIAEVKKWVDVAQKLGASHIRVFGGDVPNGATEEQAAAWAAETLNRSAEYSGSRGIILGLENHGGITERAERVVQIVKAANSPWTGISLDTGNFHEDPYPQIKTCVPHAVNCQIKSEIQTGKAKPEPADWERIFGMLARAGYKGYVALEYESEKDASTEIPRLLKELRRLCAKYTA